MIVKSFFLGACLMLFSLNAVATPKKILLVMFENTSYDTALKQPFFHQFANSGALLSNFHAVSHPSQPNYVALVAGSTLGVRDDENVNLKGSNLADLLESKGLNWHVYAEDFPGNCSLGRSQGQYYRKHNPLISFTNIQSNPTRCAKITDSTAFADDFKNGRLTDFTMMIPNVDNDGHDTGPAFADKWFAKTFGPFLQDAKAMEGVLIFALFDEDDGMAGNHIYAAINGPDVIPGTVLSSRYDDYSVLGTIEDLLKLGNLSQQDATSPHITGFLK